MKFRILALVLVALLLLPMLAGCGRNEKAMQSPNGMSPREMRDQKKGTGQ